MASTSTVDTEEGLVTRHGTAPSDVEKAESESIARGIGGTRPVRNLIRVVPGVERSDAALEPRVEQRLASEHRLAAEDIDVAVSNGVVRR